MKVRKYVRLRMLVVNGHVGIAFKHGAMRWLLRQFPMVDIIFVQEGRGAKGWKGDLGGRYDFYPQPRSADQPMTYVLVKKKRFAPASIQARKDIRHGGQYPRELNGVVVTDRRTGQTLSLSSLHPDPLGRGFLRASPTARASHIKQVGAYVDWHDEQAPDVLPFSAGDTNEWLPTTTVKDSARDQFADIGMTPLFLHVKNPGPVDLMEIFARFSSEVKAVKRVVRRVPIQGIDHPVVYGVVKIRRR